MDGDFGRDRDESQGLLLFRWCIPRAKRPGLSNLAPVGAALLKVGTRIGSDLTIEPGIFALIWGVWHRCAACTASFSPSGHSILKI